MAKNPKEPENTSKNQPCCDCDCSPCDVGAHERCSSPKCHMPKWEDVINKGKTGKK